MLRQYGFAALIIVLLTGLAGAQDMQQVKNPSPADSYTVVYASRLLGYYRFPEVETTKANSCTGAITDDAAPEASLFQTALDKADQGKVGTTVRVATGDNFAHDFQKGRLF